MSTIDVEALLLEIDAGAPCGPNLDADPAFGALEREVLGKPEVQYGNTITAAVTPDWKRVRAMAAALLERSRDLRLVLHLLRADLSLSGIEGLAGGLALIARLLDVRWETVHPALDPDDGLDPTLRINSLAILTDTGSLLRELKEATVLVLPGLGPLSIKLLEIAQGETAPPKGTEKLAIASIEAAIADLGPSVLASSVDALARALASIAAIETTLLRQVGSSQALNLDPLARLLRRTHDFLARQQVGAQAVEAPAAVSEGGPLAIPAAVAGAAPAASGEIGGRDDVLRMLDKLISYYGKHEPSSPIPILLVRAKRLAPMNFLEIMQDLAPGGMAQIAVLQGPEATP